MLRFKSWRVVDSVKTQTNIRVDNICKQKNKNNKSK